MRCQDRVRCGVEVKREMFEDLQQVQGSGRPGNGQHASAAGGDSKERTVLVCNRTESEGVGCDCPSNERESRRIRGQESYTLGVCTVMSW